VPPTPIADPYIAFRLMQMHWPEIAEGPRPVRSLSRWGGIDIARRYQDEDTDALENASVCAGGFINRVAEKLRAALAAGTVTEQQAESTLNAPEFVEQLRAAVLRAAETPGEAERARLAQEIIARLAPS